MINIISVEFMKLKRKKIWILLLCALIVYLLSIVGTIPQSGREVNGEDFRSFLINPYMLILFFHTIIIGILAISIFSTEYNLKTIGQIVVAGTSMFQLFMAKLIVIFTISFFLMFGVILEIIACGIAFGYQEITLSNILLTFLFFLLSAATLVFGILPVIFLGILLRKNTLLPITSLFMYLMITILPSMGILKIETDLLAYIYPFGGAVILQRELLYYMLPVNFTGWSQSTIIIPLCILCLGSFSLLFSALSVYFLKKKNM